jgi:uncharacterized membrane protein SirB2
MNKYQKIALLIGLIILALIFGKRSQNRFQRDRFFWKGIVIVVATLLIISYLKKLGKKK